MSSTDGSHKVGIVTASAGTGKTYDLTSRIEAEIARRARAGTGSRQHLHGEGRRGVARARPRAADLQGRRRERGAAARRQDRNDQRRVRRTGEGVRIRPRAVADRRRRRRERRQGDFPEGLPTPRSAPTPTNSVRSRALFGYGESPRDRRDWRDDVNKIVELARANNIDADTLAACAERSIAGFEKLVPAPLPGETGESLDAGLRQALRTLPRQVSDERGGAHHRSPGLGRDPRHRGAQPGRGHALAALGKALQGQGHQGRGTAFRSVAGSGGGLRPSSSLARSGQTIHRRGVRLRRRRHAQPMRNTRGIGGSSTSSIKTASRWNFSATPISNSSCASASNPSSSTNSKTPAPCNSRSSSPCRASPSRASGSAIPSRPSTASAARTPISSPTSRPRSKGRPAARNPRSTGTGAAVPASSPSSTTPSRPPSRRWACRRRRRGSIRSSAPTCRDRQPPWASGASIAISRRRSPPASRMRLPTERNGPSPATERPRRSAPATSPSSAAATTTVSLSRMRWRWRA